LFFCSNALCIWLGKIRDSQLPEKMVIDEEGYGVELIAEEAKNDTVLFRVEPWFRKEGWRVISAMEIIDRRELIKAFHDGVMDMFISSSDRCHRKSIKSANSIVRSGSYKTKEIMRTMGDFPTRASQNS
jgi:hypothetical protein